jgi:hypothetical protein
MTKTWEWRLASHAAFGRHAQRIDRLAQERLDLDQKKAG